MAICPKCQQESAEVLDPCPSGDGYFCVEEEEFYSYNDDRLLGRKIADRFIVESVLGRGSMSRVYRAHQGQVDRSVALKVFQPETILGRDSQGEADTQERSRAEARFVQEAQVLGKLTHPNCVTVYDFGLDEDGQFLYMAMEHVAGVSLRTAVRRGLKFDAIVEIARQVLQALREAHSLDIVHRDLKPENIHLSFRYSSEEQVVKVLDFGIAKLLRGESENSGQGKLFGTPAYMSPEQCRGDSEAIGPMADIYAFGCVMYEMVCGSLPFPYDDPEKMVRAHLYDEVPEVSPRQGLDVPSSVASFITTCLQKEPEDRFASAHEALDVLEEAVRRADVPFGSGLTVRNDGHVQRKHRDQSRKVEVPENALSGEELDPIGDDEDDGGSASGSGPPPVPETEGSPHQSPPGPAPSSQAEPTSSPEQPSMPSPSPRQPPEPSESKSPPAAPKDDGGGSDRRRRASDTLAGDAAHGWREWLADVWKRLDQQLLAVIAAIFAALSFSVIVFYYIYATMAQ